MGNVFGNILGLNRKAQDLTAEIEDATNTIQPGNSQGAGNLALKATESLGVAENSAGQVALAENPDDNRDKRSATSEQNVTNGQMISEVMSQETVTPREVVQATEELVLAEERNEGVLGYEDEVSPGVERAELAHEQNLMQIEEDAEREANWGTDHTKDDPDWDDNDGDRSENILNQTENSVLQQYDRMVAPKFVKNERAVAEGTMAAVEKITSGKQDARIVDILTLYERSANAMREMDEAV